MRNVSFSRTLYRENKIQLENGSENDTNPRGNPVSLSVKVLEKITEEAVMTYKIQVNINMNGTVWTDVLANHILRLRCRWDDAAFNCTRNSERFRSVVPISASSSEACTQEGGVCLFALFGCSVISAFFKMFANTLRKGSL